MVSAVACLSVSAITLLPVGYWVYHVINDNTEVEIYDYTGTQSTLYTPYSNNNLPITTIASNAFDGNTYLNKIVFTKNMTTVSHHAFLNASNLQTVEILSTNVATIDSYAFAGCSSLTSINLENTFITTVANGTFMNCTSLAEIAIPDTVTSISVNAFTNCGSLSKIVIPASVESIDGDAFVGCSDELTIYCYTDSHAHRYAVNNDINFILIDQTPVETYILGDVDNDGKVTISDATDIQLLIAEIIEPYDENTVLRGDITKDEVLSIMDATYIQRYIAEFDDGLHIGETFEV